MWPTAKKRKHSEEKDDMGDSANSPPPLQMPQMSPPLPPLLDIAEIRSKCLSQREKHAEDFLLQEIDACTRESLERYAGAPADENLQRAFDLAMEKVRNVSVTLAHKFQPVVKQQLAHQQNAILDATFAKTTFREVPLATKVSFYKRCFFQLFDDDRCVSFETKDRELGKKVHLRDLFYLTMWTFATCRRAPGDHLLQLAVTGISSVGKSTLVENIMLEGGHNMTSEEGVGRYDTGKKNLLLLHDVELDILIAGPDADKIRALTRGETTTAKIHSSVTILPPLFVLITSNGRLLDHRVREKALLGTQEFTAVLSSKLNATGNGKRKRDQETVNAIKNRFLECHIRARPANRVENFKRLGTFQRMHFVLAVFPRIVQLLEKYKPSDFYTEALYYYALAGLKLNLDYFDSFYRYIVDAVSATTIAQAAANVAATSSADASVQDLASSPLLKLPPPLPPNFWQDKIKRLEEAAAAGAATATATTADALSSSSSPHAHDQAQSDMDVADLGINLMSDWVN
jgi:hypothetical protein